MPNRSAQPIPSGLERGLIPVLGRGLRAQPLHASGFCATWRVSGSGAAAFVKTVPLARAEVLHAEADGLRALAATATVRVPAVLALDDAAAQGVTLLALEWLDLRAPDAGFGARLGAALAALHAAAPPALPAGVRFGWRRDNWIGATPQSNSPHAEWVDFFCGQRLDAMCRRLLAADPSHAALCAAVEAVMQRWPALFDDGHVPQPSLLHGDLWSGNWGMLADGSAVIFDPAVAIGDAEADLAMMELFGAPPPGFWPAYRAAGRGLHPGYARRRAVYQLYHLLNHALLFGGGYARQALSLAQQVLRTAAG
ncbi:fructosamine kinase family protein [Thiomonas sp.]|uniref:fructosamine kinase family protein n=1 Tax=Thiomonas sp. TaxID=2047785 RepID=UPI002633059C|nr:fructosamine kinase family protein [Thiomonas sp.]